MQLTATDDFTAVFINRPGRPQIAQVKKGELLSVLASSGAHAGKIDFMHPAHGELRASEEVMRLNTQAVTE